MADLCFQKMSGRANVGSVYYFQINGFWAVFYIKKTLNFGQKGAGSDPAPSKSATVNVIQQKTRLPRYHYYVYITTSPVDYPIY